MNKHTPAPWKIENRGGWPVITENHGDIAYMKDRLSMQANAQLIAAAPELLEALQTIVTHWRENDSAMFASDLATDTINAIRNATR